MQEDTDHRKSVARPTAVLEAALVEALQDEYKAQATYAKVIETFGPIRPFINIVEAEGRHARALERQFRRLELSVPADEWADRVAAPDSVSDACEDAISSEIENAAMYERLLAVVEDTEVHELLLRLQDASQNRHLPAFRRAAEGGGRGPDRGKNRGQCRGNSSGRRIRARGK